MPLIDQESTGIRKRSIDDFPVPKDHVPGFRRLLRIAFPTCELRRFEQGWSGTAKKLHVVPAAGARSVRYVDILTTNKTYKLAAGDWPMRWSARSELVATWSMPNNDTVWVVHFEFDDHQRIERAISDFLVANPHPRKIDSRNAPAKDDTSGRILIQWWNADGWFSVIEAAIPDGLISPRAD